MDISALRAVTADDAPRLLELSNAVDRDWWGQDETDADEVEQRLRLAGDLSRRSRLVETMDGVVGFALSFGSHDDTDLTIDPALPPDARRQVEDALLGWLVEVGISQLESPSQAADRLEAFARHGFVPTWSSFELERDPELPLPDAPLPDGVELRPFDRDAHSEAVHALIYGFWTEIPTHRYRDLEEWRDLFLGYASYDAEQQVVAWRGSRPVGAAICRTYTDDAGWVMQLGVAPEERGRGLGLALLVEASARLGAVQGVTTVGLSVVARNARALGLYRSVGFEITREWIACQRAPLDEA
jgi:ribosomal protein S18 acetylase RimI-like enzyme